MNANDAGERLVALTLALEEALGREAWDEADDLFAAREKMLVTISVGEIPREMEEIDARILVRLQAGQADVRREILALSANQRARVAYGGSNARNSLLAA